jgi:hypothetical protein
MFTVLHRPQFICQAEVFWLPPIKAYKRKIEQEEAHTGFFAHDKKRMLKQT